MYCRLILWRGDKHSGKTTSAGRLVEQACAEGFNVAGILAPSVYTNGRLKGFDIVDLQSGRQTLLASRNENTLTNRFVFTDTGLKFGREALSLDAVKDAELIIVDEFGPIELAGKGWRKSVDSLLAFTNAYAGHKLVLLVVRNEIVEEVQKLYADIPCRQLAAQLQSVPDVIEELRQLRLQSPDEPGLRLTNMLLIGSAGRNSGKTQLACDIIERFGKDKDITGIKVTTVGGRKGECPRGGKGCGVCSSFEGNFIITEETDGDSKKDTSRLLAAGAKQVFWIRTEKKQLMQAMGALFETIGRDAVLVCESNSLRTVIEPGLFLMVKDPASTGPKQSAKSVIELADRIVSLNGKKFDIELGDICLTDGEWSIRAGTTAIIMAGGSNSRIGCDKALLPINGRPMIEHIYNQLRPYFKQIIISAGGPDKFSFLDARVVRDRVAGQGPLMGIASAMQASAHDLNFVIACDIPNINISFLKRLLRESKDFEAVIPVSSENKYEPLFAVYRKTLLDAMDSTLAAGRRKIMQALDGRRVKYLPLDNADWLRNLNTMDDYIEYGIDVSTAL
jgi:molybdopterin-guanine dinucleotide biosynthesis protein A/nucleoside-triphosphatase THEP1